MNTRQDMKSGSSIEQQLSSIQMSEHQREAALNAARIAGLFVDAIMWFCGKIERPGTGVFAKPNLKY